MYKIILVPHAGTPAGDEALNHAIFSAKASSAKLIVLHIVEEIHRPRTMGLSEDQKEKLLGSINDANESIKKEAKKELEQKIADLKADVRSDVMVVVGDPAEIILDVINQENVDLVVMAKRRKLKGVKKLLSLGSVSRKIVENSPCPILLIDVEKI